MIQRLAAVACACAFVSAALADPVYHDIDQFTAPTAPAMMVYAPAWNALLLKNSASAIFTVDIPTRAATTRLANTRFTDMTLSPSGRYVFAADYGGENPGYGTPANTHYVHRLDLSTMTWEQKTAYIAGQVQAVSDTQVILKSLDQWVTFTNNAWGPGLALTVLNSSSGYFAPGYYATVYAGDFRYDARTGRLLHGSGSGEMQAFKLSSGQFVKQEGSGLYGSANGFGGTTVLATDGSAFYYGRLQVDALDTAHNLRTFPELIYAANGSLAFGNGKYYDAHTGALLGILPFNTTVYALNPTGTDFWALDAATNTVHHFSLDALTASPWVVDFGGIPNGTTSPRSAVAITNTASSPVTIATVSTSLPFAVSSTDCATLAAGATCNVMLTLTPSGTGSVLGTLTLNYAGASTPLAIELSGTGVAPTGGGAVYVDRDHFTAPTGASMLVYAPAWDALVFKNSASLIAAVDIPTRTPLSRFANTWFTDMTLSPSGRYVFAADYGGENIGYGTPANTHYVHRLDLATMTWDQKLAYIAGNVQAVSDTQVILKSRDQWVSFTNNAWGAGLALTQLNTDGGSLVYAGDFRYDARTGRLLHGNSGLSSQEIQAFRLVSNSFAVQEGSAVYGSAQGYGGTTVLATDGSAFYYGRLQVDPLNVAHNLRVFPELIYAANGSFAFGDGKYYDAHTGDLLGILPFNTKVYALNPVGSDFWAFDAATNTVHHFSSAPLSVSQSLLDLGGTSIDTTSPPFAVTFTNTTSSPMTITTVSATPPFTVASTDCGTLEAGEACTVRLTLTPLVTGAIPGTLTIDYAGSSGPMTIFLAGTGERSLVSHYYRAILNREPDAGGKAYWEGEAARLASFGADMNEVWYVMAETFFNSAEYLSYNKTDAQYVADLYNTFFNRAPDASGQGYWVGQIQQGMPREVVLYSFLFSTEFRDFTTRIFGASTVRPETNMVMDLYRGAFNRLPDSSGFAFYLAALRSAQCKGPDAVTKTVSDLAGTFLTSAEYANRARDDMHYVGDLYNVFLRRGGDLTGVQYWLTQLATRAQTREQLRTDFVQSPEFSLRVTNTIAAGCSP